MQAKVRENYMWALIKNLHIFHDQIGCKMFVKFVDATEKVNSFMKVFSD